jgi:hypothetical protein
LVREGVEEAIGNYYSKEYLKSNSPARHRVGEFV